eukprot:2006816-Pleurochrysis_carterae.AAC.3
MRYTRGLPSALSVAYPGGAWQYPTLSGSSSPCRYAATKSQRRMRMPAELATAARARRDVGRMVAQKCAATLPLVNPNEAHQGPIYRDVRAVNHRPPPVCCVIRYFRSLCFPPTDAILCHRLFAPCAASPCRLPTTRAQREHGGAAGAQGIVPERTFEGATLSGRSQLWSAVAGVTISRLWSEAAGEAIYG